MIAVSQAVSGRSGCECCYQPENLLEEQNLDADLSSSRLPPSAENILFAIAAHFFSETKEDE